MKICIPYYRNPAYFPYIDNNPEDCSFVVKLSTGFFIGDIISKGKVFDEDYGVFYPSVENGRCYAVMSPMVVAGTPSISEQSNFEYQTAERVFVGDMISVSDDVLENNFFNKDSFHLVKKSVVTLSENNERIPMNIMVRIK